MQNVMTLFNKFTADDKYSRLHRENFRQPIQMQLSLKPKTFFKFYSAVLKSKINLKHFKKNVDPHK